MSFELKTNEKGSLIYYPLTGWGMKQWGGVLVLLALRYAENPRKLEMDDYDQFQLMLTPAMALDLAKELRNQAQCLLDGYDEGAQEQQS